MRHYYTPEQEMFIAEHYPTYGPDGTVARFAERFGIALRPWQIRRKACRLKVAGEVPPEWYKLAEIADLFQVSPQALLTRINTGSLPARRFGRQWLIHQKTLPELEAYYLARTPWPALTVAEATARLNYCHIKIIKSAIQRGGLTAVKVKKSGACSQWMIKASEIERAEAYLKATGHTAVPWQKLKAG